MPSTDLQDLLTQGATGLRPELLRSVGAPVMSRDRTVVPYEMDDDDLVQAAMTALLLGQPLILAGNPGVGKTQFAMALSRHLDLTFLPPHQVKSSDEGRELLYQFDQVGRYRAQADSPLAHHIHFTALGLAIVRSAGPDAPVVPGTIQAEKLVGAERLAEIMTGNGQITLRDLFPTAFRADAVGPERCVVLLDELDKAPRDAPNDILGEIEGMRFRIPELEIEVAAQGDHWPVVIITTNSERSLPDAFLRRCIFHWIEDPSEERLIRIVALHLAPHDAAGGDLNGSVFLATAARLFTQVCAQELNKPPATAEFVAFVLSLWHRGMRADMPVTLEDDRVRRSIGTLLKTRIDRQKFYPSRDGS